MALAVAVVLFFIGLTKIADEEEIGQVYLIYALILAPTSYIWSLLMYGFAELLENSIANKTKTEKADSTPTENISTDVLDNLLVNGLITPEEYEEKKNSIS